MKTSGAAGSLVVRRRQKAASFRSGFVTTLALDVVARGLSAITVVVLVRGLAVSDYAFMTLFITVAQFASSAATGGVRTMYLRTEAERASRGGHGTAQDFVAVWVRAALVLCGLAVVALGASRFVHVSSTATSGTKLVLYSLAFAAGFATVELAIAHEQAHRRFFRAGCLSASRAAIILIAAILVTVARVPDLLALLFAVGVALLAVAAVVSILRRTSGPMVLHVSTPRFSREELWLTAYFGAAAGFAYVDIVVAGALLENHEVASLGAALRYLAVVLGAVPALGAVLRVRTSQADIVDSHENQRRMMIAWARTALPPVAVCFVLIGLLAPVAIPKIDGGRYPDSIPVLQIFLGMAFTAYVTAPMANMLMAQRRYRVLAFLYSLALTINLIGDILVAKTYGVIGIAVVSCSTYVVLDSTMALTALRATRPAAVRPRG